jgi:hypothetical protein
MPIQIREYTAHERSAALAFNERMRAARAPTDFLLPDAPGGLNGAAPADAPVRWTNFLALDDAAEARGGFLLMEQAGWLNGRTVSVANYQSPLSEGIRDSRFGLVGMHMLKFVQRRAPHAYVVGMGAPDRPLPRLLAAAGWSIAPVPFFFHLVRPGRVLREMPLFRQRKALELVARLAAHSGAGWAGIRLLQARRAVERWRARRLCIDRLTRWDAWVDDLWESVREGFSFAAVRDRRALEHLYPLEQSRYLAVAARDGGRPVGWAVAVKTPMRGHRQFGNLTVATILDAVARPAFAAPLLARVVEAIAGDADLVITNQSHEIWQEACRRCGFLRGPSNFLFAASRPLAEAIGPTGAGRTHIVRGDGDGRIHL